MQLWHMNLAGLFPEVGLSLSQVGARLFRQSKACLVP